MATSLQEYYSDYTIKILYGAESNKLPFKLNQIGPGQVENVPEADFTIEDSEAIFINFATGNDTTGTGLRGAPYKTLLKGINSTTSDKPYVLCNDVLGGMFMEDLSSADTTYFSGFYSDSAPAVFMGTRVIPDLQTNLYPYNTVYKSFAKTGNDVTGDGTYSNPYLTVAKAASECDATHQAIMCMDNQVDAVYEEQGIEFTGNFLGMYAWNCKPTFRPTLNSSFVTVGTEQKPQTEFEGDLTSGTQTRTVTLQNGNIVIVYTDHGDSLIGKFTIISESGNEVVAPTAIEAATVGQYISIAVLSSGNFVCCYRTTTGGTAGRYAIFSQAGSLVKAGAQFSTGDITDTSINSLTNGGFVICFVDDNDSNKGKFIIYDEDGIESVAEKRFKNSAVESVASVGLDNGNFVIIASDFGYFNFYIYDTDGDVVVAETPISDQELYYLSVVKLDNGNFVVGASGAFASYEEDGTLVTGLTDMTIGNSNWSSISALPGNLLVMSFQDYSDVYNGKFLIFEEDASIIVAETEFESGETKQISSTVLDNGNFVISYEDVDNSNKGKFVIWSSFVSSGIKVSADSTINGFVLDTNNHPYINKLIEVNGAKPTLQWCDLKNCSPLSVDGYAIYGDNETDLFNCKVYDNDIGIYLTTNDISITNSLFYRNTEGYGIHIDGAGTGIVIEHNDFFNNYGGLRLENNDGDEEIINTNFHKNSNYDISADTEITLTYSIYTGAVSGVSAGASTTKYNPLYVNEGASDSDDLDLNLKVRILGDPADSPGKDLADDDRNSGAYDVRYIGSITDWTTIEVAKPISLMPILKFVGSSKSISRSGSVHSTKSGQWVFLPLEWQGLGLSDSEDIERLLCQDDPEIRLYLSPTTNPNNYELWNILWDEDLMLGPELWVHSEEGTQGIKLLLGRKYEVA